MYICWYESFDLNYFLITSIVFKKSLSTVVIFAKNTKNQPSFIKMTTLQNVYTHIKISNYNHNLFIFSERKVRTTATKVQSEISEHVCKRQYGF